MLKKISLSLVTLLAVIIIGGAGYISVTISGAYQAFGSCSAQWPA